MDVETLAARYLAAKRMAKQANQLQKDLEQQLDAALTNEQEILVDGERYAWLVNQGKSPRYKDLLTFLYDTCTEDVRTLVDEHLPRFTGKRTTRDLVIRTPDEAE